MLIVLPILVLAAMIGGCIWARHQENREWNNGACPDCEQGFYVSFDQDSSGAVGYKCTHCGYTTWQSWNKRLLQATN
ncbi:hypothetical protein HOB10_01005 [Candidatus Parcubacteria bacterium]|jgi:ribosomal protein S27AE|nr:hypothetical protein [Candidatus Parcubacteria bacterium]